VKPKLKRLHRLPKGFIAVCTVPAFILTIYIIIIPTIRALALSFTNASPLNSGKFVGLYNYQYMFGEDKFIQALLNTLKLMAVVPVITIFLSLVIASILSQTKLKEKALYRVVFFFPSIISMTVIAIVWGFVYTPRMGMLGGLLDMLGLGDLKMPWLGDASTALWCIAVTLVWQAVGYYMVMHVAAMDGISAEIYESATIDGASSIRKFTHITLPLVKDIIGITFVLSLSGTINLSYVLGMVMTSGGPNGSSTVLLHYIYNQGIVNGNFGYAMAVTVFTLAISIVLSFVSRALTTSKESR
jgi:N-acetylglucosamine transport system permease protein